MMGGTHFVFGMASALAIMQPNTVSGVIASMAGGAIGGWIVDVDIKDRDMDTETDSGRERIYNTIIDALCLLVFFVVDYFTGKGMCQYVIDNWGVMVWGALLGLLVLVIVGLNTSHRTFTHSIFALALFSILVYMACRPATVPFAIGYASHLFLDLFNKRGPRILFPLKWRPCLGLCAADGTVNRVLFWISLIATMVLSAVLFSKALGGMDQDSNFLSFVNGKSTGVLNPLLIYLIIINVITFIGYLINYHSFVNDIREAYSNGREYKYKDYDTAESRFKTFLLSILVFIGGGVALLITNLIHFDWPGGHNGNRWAFCYSSIMFWLVIYNYVCNPFGFESNNIVLLSVKHLPLLIYLLVINVINAIRLLSLKKERVNNYDYKHTFIFFVGALGGTIGAILMAFTSRYKGQYGYIFFGFLLMMLSQIMFIIYMMKAGVF
ncbi:MAG: metal-dependent hydrolase [Lachnospiraceae bacterium]|nr:metal-dependent hydrolase [Lachnospiraceae bacterium]